ANGQFWVPGLLYLSTVNSTVPTGISATGSITATGSVYNDYFLPIAGYEGIYFGTNNLSLPGAEYTNLNSLVNFGSAAQLSQYQNSVYQVANSPSSISNTLNVVPNANAVRNYSFFYGS
ncbi:MAG: hypothetical protein ACP5RH_11010, partial [Leptodesmis sp.]|uniref:hypothetical protein n=1 Tax=Leptodesmis sp. TaxID=3100501 RepID=UPI003D106D17